MKTALLILNEDGMQINVELPVETGLRSTFDEVSGCEYSVDHKPYMQMIDHETGEIYLLENSVFRREYAKGRRLNPGQIKTFQDVAVVGVPVVNAENHDIWGNENYLNFVQKKAYVFDKKISHLKDQLEELEDAKRDFTYHVFEYVKEQCGNADAMFKHNLVAMVGIPGFYLLEEAGYIELASNVNGDDLYTILEELEIE